MRRLRLSSRIAIAVIALLLIGVGWVYYDRHATHRAGEKHLEAVVAKLGAIDPRWRLENIEADQPNIPDEENAALLIPKFHAAMRGRKFEVRRADGLSGTVTFGDHPNRFLDADSTQAIRKALEENEEALAIVRSFDKYRRGHIRIVFAPDFVSTEFRDVIAIRPIFEVASFEAERLCSQGKSDEPFQVVRSMLSAARTIDGEAAMIGALVRIAVDHIVAYRVQRNIALIVPRGGLAETQSALIDEADADFVWRSYRTERAGLNSLFEEIRAGRLDFRDVLADNLDRPAPVRGSTNTYYRTWLDRPHLPEEHASCLEYAATICEVLNRPDCEQLAAAVAIPVPVAEAGHLAVSKVTVSYSGVLKASLRNRAQLRCAAAGIAVERFRLLTARWPESLDEIPKVILPAVPADPFDGKPLRFAKRADGVTVYSIGPDEVDNGGNFPAGARPGDAGTDIVFRLYNPDQRGLPPLPKPKKTEDDDDGDVPLEIGPKPRAIDPK